MLTAKGCGQGREQELPREGKRMGKQRQRAKGKGNLPIPPPPLESSWQNSRVFGSGQWTARPGADPGKQAEPSLPSTFRGQISHWKVKCRLYHVTKGTRECLQGSSALNNG